MKQPKDDYLRQVAEQLHCPAKEKKNVLQQVRTMLAENGLEDTGYDRIVEELGEPREIAQTFYEYAAPSALYAEQRARQNHRRLVIALLAFIAAVVTITSIILASLAVINYNEQRAYRNGYYVETLYCEEPQVISENTEG